MFLEGEGIDTGELTCETVCGESVVGSRGVISAAIYQRVPKRAMNCELRVARCEDRRQHDGIDKRTTVEEGQEDV